MNLLDNQQFSFDCPACKRKVNKSVRTLRQSDQKCPHCGANFDTSKFDQGINEAERELERFKRDLGNIKFTI